MKYIISFLTAALFLTGCNEDKYLRLPAVETSSVEVSGTDIILTGKMIDNGNAGVWTLGFCYDRDRVPATIQRNQTLVDWVYEDGTFQASLQGLKQDSTYYFQAFIVTDLGFATGEVIEYTVPRFEAPEAPCENNLTMNRVTDDGRNYTVTAYARESDFSETYDIAVDCGPWNPDITFSFREKPVTGIYSTANRIDRYGTTNDVSVKITKTVGYGATTIPVNSGQFVYVNRMDEDKLILSFCDLAYKMNVNNMNFDVVLSGKVESEVR